MILFTRHSLTNFLIYVFAIVTQVRTQSSSNHNSSPDLESDAPSLYIIEDYSPNQIFYQNDELRKSESSNSDNTYILSPLIDINEEPQISEELSNTNNYYDIQLPPEHTNNEDNPETIATDINTHDINLDNVANKEKHDTSSIVYKPVYVDDLNHEEPQVVDLKASNIICLAGDNEEIYKIMDDIKIGQGKEVLVIFYTYKDLMYTYIGCTMTDLKILKKKLKKHRQYFFILCMNYLQRYSKETNTWYIEDFMIDSHAKCKDIDHYDLKNDQPESVFKRFSPSVEFNLNATANIDPVFKTDEDIGYIVTENTDVINDKYSLKPRYDKENNCFEVHIPNEQIMKNHRPYHLDKYNKNEVSKTPEVVTYHTNDNNKLDYDQNLLTLNAKAKTNLPTFENYLIDVKKDPELLLDEATDAQNNVMTQVSKVNTDKYTNPYIIRGELKFGNSLPANINLNTNSIKNKTPQLRYLSPNMNPRVNNQMYASLDAISKHDLIPSNYDVNIANLIPRSGVRTQMNLMGKHKDIFNAIPSNYIVSRPFLLPSPIVNNNRDNLKGKTYIFDIPNTNINNYNTDSKLYKPTSVQIDYNPYIDKPCNKIQAKSTDLNPCTRLNAANTLYNDPLKIGDDITNVPIINKVNGNSNVFANNKFQSSPIININNNQIDVQPKQTVHIPQSKPPSLYLGNKYPFTDATTNYFSNLNPEDNKLLTNPFQEFSKESALNNMNPKFVPVNQAIPNVGANIGSGINNLPILQLQLNANEKPNLRPFYERTNPNLNFNNEVFSVNRIKNTQNINQPLMSAKQTNSYQPISESVVDLTDIYKHNENIDYDTKDDFKVVTKPKTNKQYYPQAVKYDYQSANLQSKPIEGTVNLYNLEPFKVKPYINTNFNINGDLKNPSKVKTWIKDQSAAPQIWSNNIAHSIPCTENPFSNTASFKYATDYNSYPNCETFKVGVNKDTDTLPSKEALTQTLPRESSLPSRYDFGGFQYPNIAQSLKINTSPEVNNAFKTSSRKNKLIGSPLYYPRPPSNTINPQTSDMNKQDNFETATEKPYITYLSNLNEDTNRINLELKSNVVNNNVNSKQENLKQPFFNGNNQNLYTAKSLPYMQIEQDIANFKQVNNPSNIITRDFGTNKKPVKLKDNVLNTNYNNINAFESEIPNIKNSNYIPNIYKSCINNISKRPLLPPTTNRYDTSNIGMDANIPILKTRDPNFNSLNVNTFPLTMQPFTNVYDPDTNKLLTDALNSKPDYGIKWPCSQKYDSLPYNPIYNELKSTRSPTCSNLSRYVPSTTLNVQSLKTVEENSMLKEDTKTPIIQSNDKYNRLPNIVLPQNNENSNTDIKDETKPVKTYIFDLNKNKGNYKYVQNTANSVNSKDFNDGNVLINSGYNNVPEYVDRNRDPTIPYSNGQFKAIMNPYTKENKVESVGVDNINKNPNYYYYNRNKSTLNNIPNTIDGAFIPNDNTDTYLDKYPQRNTVPKNPCYFKYMSNLNNEFSNKYLPLNPYSDSKPHNIIPTIQNIPDKDMSTVSQNLLKPNTPFTSNLNSISSSTYNTLPTNIYEQPSRTSLGLQNSASCKFKTPASYSSFNLNPSPLYTSSTNVLPPTNLFSSKTVLPITKDINYPESSLPLTTTSLSSANLLSMPRQSSSYTGPISPCTPSLPKEGLEPLTTYFIIPSSDESKLSFGSNNLNQKRIQKPFLRAPLSAPYIIPAPYKSEFSYVPSDLNQMQIPFVRASNSLSTPVTETSASFPKISSPINTASANYDLSLKTHLPKAYSELNTQFNLYNAYIVQSPPIKTLPSSKTIDTTDFTPQLNKQFSNNLQNINAYPPVSNYDPRSINFIDIPKEYKDSPPTAKSLSTCPETNIFTQNNNQLSSEPNIQFSSLTDNPNPPKLVNICPQSSTDSYNFNIMPNSLTSKDSYTSTYLPKTVNPNQKYTSDFPNTPSPQQIGPALFSSNLIETIPDNLVSKSSKFPISPLNVPIPKPYMEPPFTDSLSKFANDAVSQKKPNFPSIAPITSQINNFGSDNPYSFTKASSLVSPSLANLNSIPICNSPKSITYRNNLAYPTEFSTSSIQPSIAQVPISFNPSYSNMVLPSFKTSTDFSTSCQSNLKPISTNKVPFFNNLTVSSYSLPEVFQNSLIPSVGSITAQSNFNPISISETPISFSSPSEINTAQPRASYAYIKPERPCQSYFDPYTPKTESSISFTPKLLTSSISPSSSISSQSNILCCNTNLSPWEQSSKLNRQYVDTQFNKEIRENKNLLTNKIVDELTKSAKLYLKSSGALNNCILNNIENVSIPLKNIGIAKYMPTGNMLINTENPNIDLKTWYSNLKILKAKLVLEAVNAKVVNFMPIIKNNAKFDLDFIEEEAKNAITKVYGEPLVVKDVNCKPYVVVNNVENAMFNDRLNILWPVYRENARIY